MSPFFITYKRPLGPGTCKLQNFPHQLCQRGEWLMAVACHTVDTVKTGGPQKTMTYWINPFLLPVVPTKSSLYFILRHGCEMKAKDTKFNTNSYVNNVQTAAIVSWIIVSSFWTWSQESISQFMIERLHSGFIPRWSCSSSALGTEDKGRGSTGWWIRRDITQNHFSDQTFLQIPCWVQKGWSSKFLGNGGKFPRRFRSISMHSLAVAMIV